MSINFDGAAFNTVSEACEYCVSSWGNGNYSGDQAEAIAEKLADMFYDSGCDDFAEFCRKPGLAEDLFDGTAPDIWYAVQRDPSDDWGTGSFWRDEAMQMLRNDCPEGLVAVIDVSTDNPVCIDEVRL